MKAILINYQFTPTWLLDYPELDYFIIDQSEDKEWLKDFPQERIAYVKNEGNVDYQKLVFLVDTYDHLPDVFLWGKTNLFKYVDEKTFKKALKKGEFCPLLKKDHNTYSDKFGVVCKYNDDGMYEERHDNWYVQQFKTYFPTLNDYASYLGIKSLGGYIPFNPGGNFLLTKERVHRYAQDFYIRMAESLPHSQLPCEAQFCERLYYTLWK